MGLEVVWWQALIMIVVIWTLVMLTAAFIVGLKSTKSNRQAREEANSVTPLEDLNNFDVRDIK